MDGRFGSHRVEECNVVDTAGQVREQLADPLAGLAVLMELPARLDDSPLIFVPAAAEGFDVDRFSIHADHRRLIVERVDMARTAIHEQEDDALRTGRKLG